MNPPNYRIRRATLEDLSALKALWGAMRLPVSELGLEKRLTEFQVAEGPDGKIVGAIGVQILKAQAQLHSEAFADFSQADELRQLFWERIQPLASNHGVLRLWTREKVPFWTRMGFQAASAQVLEKLPETWDRSLRDWLTLQLKDEDAIASLEKEITMLMRTEKQKTAKLLERAKLIKNFWLVIAFILAFLVLGMGLVMLW
ncbi:MAG TPA: hypothetical protein VKA67_13600, partial [Verrucomicrobiae bacterium]|nr:hypothetical protein [Verrucomicrobiae bacterium]